MKIGKRIYSLLFILFTALALVTACNNPYKGMTLSIEGGNLLVQEYSEEEGKNFFDIKAIVGGVDSKKVDTSVSFTGYNPKIIKPATSSPNVNGGTTIQKFAILDTGRTTIKVSTIEGSNSGVLTETIDVNITRGVDGFEFTYTTLPIIRGVATDVTTNVYDGSGYITYTPSYTTEREVTLTALDMYDEELTEGVEINGSTVTVTDTEITKFKLQATSVNNEDLDPIVTEVEVLDPISADDFSVKQLVDGTIKDLNQEYIGNTLMYNINLSNADSDANNENAKTMDVYMGEDSINSYDSKYVLRARNLNISNTGINGLEYSAARRNDDGSYTISEGRGIGNDNIVLLVYYKGYENIFAPIEIPVNVSVNTFPTTINFVRNTTDTTTMENIVLYKNTNYVNTIGTSVYLQIRNSRGNLIGQQAYVYAVNKVTGEQVNNGIMIYRYVGGNLERVYATTPVNHGDQLFINYVYNTEFVKSQYMLVAKSVFFEDVYSYTNPDNVGKNNLQLLESDVNVFVPSLIISKGTEVPLTDIQVFGTPNPEINITDLTITSADTSMLKVRYDYEGNAVYLSAIDATKLGSVAVTIKAPNGVQSSANMTVYAPTTNDNTTFVFGGRNYIGDQNTINEINVISNSRLDGTLIIDGVEYTSIPDGVTFTSSDFDSSVITMGSDASEVHVFVLDVTKSTSLTFTLTNLNDGTVLTYKFLINVIQPITELTINTALVPSLYTRNSITMTGYDSYKNHTIVTTPQPATTTLDGEFSFNVRYNGSFYNVDTVNGNLYTFKIIPDRFIVYITALTDNGKLTGEFNVQTQLSNGETNSYSFYVYVAYSQTYTNLNEMFTVRKTNNVLITTKNAIKVESIITYLNNSNTVEFNANDLVGADGAYTSGHIQTFDYRITPNERNIFESTVILLNGEGNTLTLTESTPGVYNNDYLTITINNADNSVVVELKQLPIDDSYKIQKFLLASRDSELAGTLYSVTSSFTVKINDGTSEDFAFVITSAEQLLKINNQLDAYYRLGADIYLDAYNRDGAWKSIGTTLTPFKGWFSGEYDGHYYSIYNLRITEEDKLDNTAKLQDTAFGLFAVNQGIITDLKMVNAFVRVVYVQSKDDAKDIYVGAFAGINNGIIKNCSVETNIGRVTTDGQYINSVGKVETPLSGIIVRDRSSVAHNSFVGGVVGINAGQITDTTAKVELLANDNAEGGIVFAGGVAGANTSIDGTFSDIRAGMKSGFIEYTSANELYSNNYDVDMTFNPYTAGGVYTLVNANSTVGGVVGFNNATSTTIIKGAYVRSYIRGYNNVGGLVGTNYSAVEDCTVQTTIIANDNVGGAVGVNIATSSSTHNILNNSFQYTTTGVILLEGYITGTKVQFVGLLDKYSYFNTSIYAHSNVGGLIGYNLGISALHSYNSAYSYSTNSVTTGYDTTNTSGLYYGDIVATGTSIGGLVGYADYVELTNSLANANIQALDNTAYVGGAVGTAVAGIIVTSSQIAGNVIGTNNVGGFFGDATRISDTFASMAGMTGSDILPTINGALFSYKEAVNYSSGAYHILSSYTLLKSNGNYVDNFAYVGETKKGTQDVNVARLYLSGGAYLIDYLDSTGKLVSQISGVEEEKIVTATINVERNLVLAANSFYIGFETVNSSKNAITFTEANTKVLTYLVGTDIMSSYNYDTNTYYDNLRNFPATLVDNVTYASYGLADEGNAFSAGAQITPFEVNAITSVKGSGATNFTIYKAKASEPTGYTAGDEDTLMLGKDYYYNSTVFGGYPVAFSRSRTASGKVNLVFDIAPTDITLTAKESYMYGSDNTIVQLKIKYVTETDSDGNLVQIPVSYKLSDVINCGVVPAFADDSKFVITSLDSSILDYNNGMLTGVTPGVTRLRFVSVFDHNVVKEITVVVYYENNVWNLVDKNNNQIATGSTLYLTQGYATTINTTLQGEGINPATGATITSANADEDLAKLTINGVTLTQNVNVDFTETALVIFGDKETSVTLTISPYIEIVANSTTYRIYTGESREVTLNVVRGNYSITVKGDVTINPITSLQFDVTVKTDNPDLAIQNSYDPNYLPTIASQDVALYKVYKGSELLTPTDNLFDEVLLITPQGTNNGTFTFEISVDPSAYELSNTIVYTFRVYAMRYDGILISNQFNITVIPQQLSSVILTNYSRLFYDGTDAKPEESDVQLYKMPSDSIVPGYSGLLQIDLNPSYGKYDFITVTSSRAGIDFEQMLESQNLGEYSKMTFHDNTSPISNGIKITDKISTYFGEDAAYDGRIFVRVSAVSGLSGGTVTLTVRCHINDGNDTVVYTALINLIIIDAPRIALTVDDGNKYGVIATGMSKLINVRTYGNPDNMIIDTNGIGYNWVDGNIQLNLNAGASKADLLGAAGDEITITANVRKTINNIVYDFTDTLTLRIVKYVINSIGVEYVTNGKFVGKYNQIYSLRVIINASYNEKLNEPDYDNFVAKEDTENSIIKELAQLKASIESYGLTDYIVDGNTLFAKTGTTNTWYLVNGASVEALQVQTYNNFQVRNVWNFNDTNNDADDDWIETLSIQNTNVYATETLTAKVSFTYTNTGSAVISTNTSTADAVMQYAFGENNDELFKNNTYLFENRFSFDFSRLISEETPDPINNIEQFKDMQPKGHYILQTDLVLENWVPMEANFASLDGNSHVITIKSFAEMKDISEATSDINLGIFTKVSSSYDDDDTSKSTIIKNLTVEIIDDITIDISGYTNVKFGVIAGTNEGIITNCRVVNDAGSLIQERLNMLQIMARESNEAKAMLDAYEYKVPDSYILDNNSRKLAILGGGDGSQVSRLPVVPTIYLQGNQNQAVGNRIAGLVASNLGTGYITNCGVDNISIQGCDYVAGFVAVNNGNISSSYFRGGNVISTDSNSKRDSATAGFVVENSSNAQIQYSYAQGRFETDITGLDETTKLSFAGYKALVDYKQALNNKEDESALSIISQVEEFVNLRALNSIVYTNNYASGFVFTNEGYVNNSYSNIMVQGTASAGFAYTNSHENSFIEGCYSMSSGHGSSFSAFTGKVSATTASDKIKDCFYLVIGKQDINDATYQDKFSNLDQTEGVELSALAFKDYNSFQNYAFNTDYVANSMEKVTTGVWFIPSNEDAIKVESLNNIYADYFRHDLYSFNRPELVAANLRVTPLKVYKEVKNTDKGFDYEEAKSRKSNATEQLSNGAVALTTNSIYTSPNGGKVNMEYGKTIINPYLTDTVFKFNDYCNPTITDDGNKTETNSYIRLIKNIRFDNINQIAQTYNKTFSGDLDGNGLAIENLRILSDTTGINASSFGLFGKIEGGQKIEGEQKIEGGHVRNLNIEIEEIWGVNVPSVGVLAGIITDGTIANITVSGEDIVVQGLNVVGGVAGIVQGNSFLVNISSNVSVKANYRGNVNLFSANNSINTSVTTFNLYDSSDSSYLDNISYAGGIVGILNVEGNPTFGIKLKNFGRARRNYTEAGVVVDAQVVGGLYGYVGASTTVSDSYVVVDANTKLNATRVAGGLAGINEGTIQRSYVAHASLTQESIDNYISKNLSTLDNATSDKEISNVAYNMYGKNPHYMGGLVGMNLTGTIRDSYNKVPVNNINAEFAGGIIGLSIGGQLDSVYTTATVNAFRGIGGIIGIQTYINGNTIATDSASNFTNNYLGLIGNDKGYGLNKFTEGKQDGSTYITELVGANVWLYSHTNVNRSVRFQRDAVDAHIGVLAGLTTHKYGVVSNKINNGGFVLDNNEDDLSKTFTLRMSNDSNFFKVQYTYNTINSTVKESVNEIGHVYGSNIDTYYSSQSDILGQYSSLGENEKVVLYGKNGCYRMLSGYQNVAGSYYMFSRMQVYGSLRTLEEIVNRISTRRIGDQVTSLIGLEKSDTSFSELGVTNNAGSIIDNRIYYNWSQVEWEGTACETDSTKINSEYIFPTLSSKVEPSIVNVYTEADLKLMHDYLNAEFILQNDITIVMPWTPVGTETEPFMGIVRSKFTTGSNTEYEDFAIKQLNISQQNPNNIGLVAYSQLAHFHHFSIEPIVVKSELIFSTDTDDAVNLAVLVAQADDTTINNINIRGTSGTSKLQANAATTVGAIVAKGINGTTIEECTVSNLNITITDEFKLNGSIYAGGAFGILNYATSWVENITVTNVEINIGYNNNPFNPTDAIAIGGIGGCLEIQPNEDEETSLIDDTVSGMTYSESEINVYTQVDSGFSGTNMGIGSIFGVVQGSSYHGGVVTFESIDNSTSINIQHIDDNINATSLPVGGLFGSVQNVNITDTQYSGNIYVTTTSTANANSYINGFFTVGGIAGKIDGVQLTNSVVNQSYIMVLANLTSYFVSNVSAGGVVGETNQSFIDYVYVVSSHVGTNANFALSNIGGVVGKANNSHINHLVTNATSINAPASESYIGGLVGHMIGQNGYSGPTVNGIAQAIGLYNSVSNVDIDANMDNTIGGVSSCIGGLIGYLNVNYYTTLTISGCYATGYLSTSDDTSQLSYVGGLIGRINGGTSTTNLTNCYSLVNILVNGEYSASNKNNIVGLISGGRMTISNIYSAYDINPDLGYEFSYTDTSGNDQTHDSRVTTADLLNKGVTFDGGIFTQTKESTMPLLAWIEDATSDTSSENYVYKADIAKLAQASGTKQKPLVTNKPNQDVLGLIMIGDWGETLNKTDGYGGYVYVKEIDSLATNINPKIQNLAMTGVVISVTDDSHALGAAEFVQINYGKIIKVNLISSSEYTIYNNSGIIYGCNIEQNTGYVICVNWGIVDTCKFTTTVIRAIYAVPTYAPGVYAGSMYNTKISKLYYANVQFETGTEYNTYYEYTDVDGLNTYTYLVYRYGDKDAYLSLTKRQANNAEYYSPMNGVTDFSKFLMIAGNDYPTDNVLRLRWEFKDKFWDDDIKDEYYWENCGDWDVDGEYQDYYYNVQTLISNRTVINVNNAQQLAIVAAVYNQKQPTNGVSIIINSPAPIDLSGRIWTPIQNFSGTIDGSGCTISNMTVYLAGDSTSRGTYENAAGFIANTNGSTTVQYIKFEYANVLHMNNAPVASVVVGHAESSVTLQQVAVAKCSVVSLVYPGSIDLRYYAGFVGYLYTGTVSITNCYTILVVCDNTTARCAYIGNQYSDCTVKLTCTYAAFIKVRTGGSIPGWGIDENDSIYPYNRLVNANCNVSVNSSNYIDSSGVNLSGVRNTEATQKLQTVDLEGFDWGDTWTRFNGDGYWGLPQLTMQIRTWQDYVNSEGLGTDYVVGAYNHTLEFHVSTPEQLARVAWQLSESEWKDTKVTTAIGSKTINTIEVWVDTAEIDLGKITEIDNAGKLWEPIKFNSRFANYTIFFSGEDSSQIIKGMQITGKGDNAFVSSTEVFDAGKSTGQLALLNIEYLYFNNARVYASAEDGYDYGYGAIVVAKGTNVDIESVYITNSVLSVNLDSSAISKGISAGALAGMLTDSTIQNCSVSSTTLTTTNVDNVGGVVGYTTNVKESAVKGTGTQLSNITVKDIVISANNSLMQYSATDPTVGAALGGAVGRNDDSDNSWSNIKLDDVTINSTNIRFVGGAFGLLCDSNGSTRSEYSEYKDIDVLNLELNAEETLGSNSYDDSYYYVKCGGIIGYSHGYNIVQDIQVGGVTPYTNDKTYIFERTSGLNTISVTTSTSATKVGGAFGSLYQTLAYETYVDASVSSYDASGNAEGQTGAVFGYIDSYCDVNNAYWMISPTAYCAGGSGPSYAGTCKTDKNTLNGNNSFDGVDTCIYGGKSDYATVNSIAHTLSLTGGSYPLYYVSRSSYYYYSNVSTPKEFLEGSAWTFGININGYIIQILPFFVLCPYDYYYNIIGNTMSPQVNTSTKWNAVNAIVRYRYGVEPEINIKVTSALTLTNVYPMGTTVYPFKGSIKGIMYRTNPGVGLPAYEIMFMQTITINSWHSDVNDVLKSNIGLFGYTDLLQASYIEVVVNARLGPSLNTQAALTGYENIGSFVGMLSKGAIGSSGEFEYSSLLNIDVILNANIKGLTKVGGVAGYSLANISDSDVNGNTSNRIFGMSRIGGIVGQLGDNSTNDIVETITSCTVSTDMYVDGYSKVGGIVGYIQGKVESSTFSGNINNKQAMGDTYYEDGEDYYANSRIGGIAGYSAISYIEDNTFNGTINVSDFRYVGGIVGNVSYGEISNNTVTSSATMDKIYLKSVVVNGTTYYRPSSTSNTYGKKYVGGMVGTWDSKPTLTNNTFNGTMNLDWYFEGSGAGTGLPSTTSVMSSWWNGRPSMYSLGGEQAWDLIGGDKENPVGLQLGLPVTMGVDKDYYDPTKAGISFAAGNFEEINPSDVGIVYNIGAKICNAKDIYTEVDCTDADDTPHIDGIFAKWRAVVDYLKIVVRQYAGYEFAYYMDYDVSGFKWMYMETKSRTDYYIANCRWEYFGGSAQNGIDLWNSEFSKLTLDWNISTSYSSSTDWRSQTVGSFGFSSGTRPTSIQSYIQSYE